MRCFRCMKEFSDEYDICPYCGYICANGVADDRKGYFLPEGTMLSDRYYIGIVLGCGGFGITYKAYDTILDVVVAVKEYYPRGIVRRVHNKNISCSKNEVEVCIKEDEEEFRVGMRRFLAEARMLAQFSKHDNIVNVYNYYEMNQTAYIVMEYLDGMTLKLFLDSNDGKMSVNDSIWVMESMAKALSSLHNKGILHRDISPDNIFLCSDGKVKLLDFGAARLTGPTEYAGKVVVKVGYAPPEQYRTKGDQGPWTDLYALGATFYRALTGVIPTESPGRMKDDHLISPKEYVGRSDEVIPDYLNNVIMKLLMLEPEDRFQSAEELLYVMQKKKTVSIISTRKKLERQHACKMLVSVLLIIAPIIILIAAWIYSRYII